MIGRRMNRMKFNCPRCLKESVGREYHQECFDKLYREQQIVSAHMKKQRDDKERKAQSNMMSIALQDDKANARSRGIKPENYNELEDAEEKWIVLFNGRRFD